MSGVDPLGPEPNTGEHPASKDFARSLVAAEHAATKLRLIIGAVVGSISLIASTAVGAWVAVRSWSETAAMSVTEKVADDVFDVKQAFKAHKEEESATHKAMKADVDDLKAEVRSNRIEQRQIAVEIQQDIRAAFRGLQNGVRAPRLERPPKPPSPIDGGP